MIELRIDQYQLQKATNDLIYQQHIMNALRQAGVPVDGTLVIRSVARGTLTMHTEQDIDGDTFVWRWYDTHEVGEIGKPVRFSKGRTGSGLAYTWVEYLPAGHKPAVTATVEDEDF